MAAVGAQDYADAPIGLLPGGQQQRLRIAQALAGRPQLLLCDEPLLSLDPASQQSVTALLAAYRREHRTTVVIVTHEIPPAAGFSDRVLYIAGGRWAVGTPDAVMTTQTLSALYGTHIDVIRVPHHHHHHHHHHRRGGPAGHHHLPAGDHVHRAGHQPAGRPPGGQERR